jgi:hypothetical protein
MGYIKAGANHPPLIPTMTTLKSSEEIKRQLAEQEMADCRDVQELLNFLDEKRRADFTPLQREFMLPGSVLIGQQWKAE